MKRAVIRIGRLYQSELDLPAGSNRYQRGSMRILPGRTEPIPVVVDHDLERQIGVVDELVEWDDGDGFWLAARCSINRDDWPRVGTGASAGYRTLRRQQIGAGERILDAILEEVTVTASMTPVNPGAKVILVRDLEPATGEVVHENHRRLIRRNCGQILGTR
jgi:hypothetical protein